MTHSNVTRRRFLGTTAGFAGAAALGSLAAPAIAQERSVRVLTVGDPFQYSLRELLPEFTAKTGIKVEFEGLGYDALQARLISSFVSKTSDADVINVDQMWAGQYTDNGWIQPLNDFAKGDSDFNINDFVPETLHSISTWRGNLVTVPVASYSQGVMYRKSVFEKLGIDEPAAGWTWDQYKEILGRIHGQEVDGVKMNGTVVCGAQPVPVVHMFSQLSASLNAPWFKAFPGAETWDFTPQMNSENMKRAVSLYKELYGLSPQESINYTWFDAGTRFSQADIGMFYWWSAYFTLVNADGYMTGAPSKVKGDFGIVPCPQDGTNPSRVSLGGWSLGMPSTAGRPEEAWEFIKWATSAETQKAMGLNDKFGHMFSDFSRESLFADSDLLEVYPFLPQARAMLNGADGKLARPPAPIYTTLEGIFGLELNKVLAGQSDVDAALEQVNTLYTNALSGNFMLPYVQPSFNDTFDATKALIASLA
ncbi:MAG: extracellular solute-binding protein [Rhodobacteraceae bacterium]|nr:extracellular solute-binding protein [Paracoccaceae bacterium]